MAQKLTLNPLMQTAMRLGRLFAAALRTDGKGQGCDLVDIAGAGLPSGSGMQDSDLDGIRSQSAGRKQQPDAGWGVILWDEDGHDRNGSPGSRDSAVFLRTRLGTQA